MVHVVLRVLVWVVVLGVAYLAFGPQLFDSSETANPFGRTSTLFMPPAKQQREIELERMIEQRELSSQERAEYESIVQARRASFWKGEGMSVGEALTGVTQQRSTYLMQLVEQRGWTRQEAAMFLTVVRRDCPELLDDR